MDLSAPQKAEIVSTEVNIAPRSKRYSVAFKLRLIEEADRCQAPGERGALLRREGLFSSTLSDFRKQMARGDLDDKSAATTPKEIVSPQVLKELAASQREVRRLKRELDCATALPDLQKKVSEILGLAKAPTEEAHTRWQNCSTKPSPRSPSPVRVRRWGFRGPPTTGGVKGSGPTSPRPSKRVVFRGGR